MSTKEQFKESLSALMDGEVSELEARRILRDLDKSSAEAFGHWQLARDVMRGQTVQTVPSDFASNLCADLGAQDKLAGSSKSPKSSLMAYLGSVAVAASVALVTVFGWHSMTSSDTAAPIVAHGEAPMAQLLLNPELVSQTLAPQAPVRAQVVEMDVQQLSALMIRHSDFAARHGAPLLAPYARVVTLESRNKPGGEAEVSK
jgi:sigma-E factor negative regulatory protein RseA